jgi:hypothetical protein
LSHQNCSGRGLKFPVMQFSPAPSLLYICHNLTFLFCFLIASDFTNGPCQVLMQSLYFRSVLSSETDLTIKHTSSVFEIIQFINLNKSQICARGGHCYFFKRPVEIKRCNEKARPVLERWKLRNFLLCWCVSVLSGSDRTSFCKWKKFLVIIHGSKRDCLRHLLSGKGQGKMVDSRPATQLNSYAETYLNQFHGIRAFSNT